MFQRARRVAICVCYVLLSLCFLDASAQVDLSGNWAQKLHEDRAERSDGPEVGDYTGLPINDAARLRADSWDAAKWSVPEHQCEPHPADYAPHGPASLRIWSEVNPITQDVIAWHVIHHWMLSHRTVWMDGRSHPPDEAPHTWMGFSTGKWIGDTLVVTTTHLKEGWIRRNGIPRSDRGTLTEYWIRHGNYLTLVSMVEDPVYLTAPLVRSWNWVLNLGYQIAPYECQYRAENDLPKGFVAHHLPGTNSALGEFARTHKLSERDVRGGSESMWPEYRRGGALARAGATRRFSSPAQTKPAAASNEPHVFPIRDGIFMVSIAGANSVVSMGDDGVVVIDSQTRESAPKLLHALTELSPAPVRYIVNTAADSEKTGGNATLFNASTRTGKNFFQTGGPSIQRRIFSHENVLSALTAKSPSNSEDGSLPTDTYFTESMEFRANGQSIELLHQPSAHTDGDTIAYLRQADVIVAGNVFLTTGYPVIDLAHGGSIDGIIASLNRIIDIAVPERNQEGGTLIVPGRGRVCDEYDVVTYRDMLTVIRDRVRSMAEKGASLEQVVAARPASDYDGRYGSDTGNWTTRKFVEAVFRSLQAGGKK
jgi:cyclase